MSTPRWPLIAACVLGLLLGGCAGFTPHRLGIAAPCQLPTDVESASKECRMASIESTDKFDIAYVEFTDQGWLHSRQQLERALERLSSTGTDARDVQVVLFVHGWKHSADFDDPDVKSFREVVMPVFAERHPQRRTIGIYVGWRGQSIPMSGLRNLTFYDRKATAEHVARGSVRELISRLRALHDGVGAPPGGRRIHVTLIGHSFGGLIVFNAIAEALLDSLVRADGTAAARPIVDLALVLNPAFEASRFEPLFQVAKRLPVAPGPVTRPIFVSITSTADSATGTFFPIGRVVNSVFDHEAWTEEDQCPGGLLADGECPTIERSKRLEKVANTNTVGHVERYFTHSLAASKDSSKLPVDCSAIENPNLRGAPNSFPLWTMRASPDVIANHSDIYRPELWQFLATLGDAAMPNSAACR